jgi:hypothetical protein
MWNRMSTRSLEYAVLKKFLDENRNEYTVREDEKELLITFSPASPSARGKLGSATYMRVLCEKKGEMVEVAKLTVVDDGEESEVSVESLDGWLDFVKNVY